MGAKGDVVKRGVECSLGPGSCRGRSGAGRVGSAGLSQLYLSS